MSETLSFEEAMKQLEQIVEQLQDSQLPLEQSLKLYEEGTKLSALCQKILTAAEGKIVALKQGQFEEVQGLVHNTKEEMPDIVL